MEHRTEEQPFSDGRQWPVSLSEWDKALWEEIELEKTRPACHVIYDHPSDYPSHFVVRKCYPFPGQPNVYSRLALLCETLEEARRSIPPGLIRLERQDGDDAVIVETWI